MPTGYTCVIDDHEDVTFGQYVWRCARAFGALVTMRDDPTDAAIPDSIEPSDYNLKELAKAKARLAELNGMSPQQCETLAQADHEAAVKSWAECCAKESAIDARYAAIRTAVEAWEPPSSDHVEMKTFMLEQLKTGRPFSFASVQKPEKLSGADWLFAELKEAIRGVEYNQERHNKELERTEERNRWLRQLRESVPYESQPERRRRP